MTWLNDAVVKTAEQQVQEAKEFKRNKLKLKRIKKCSEPINNVQVATVEDRENIKECLNQWEILGNPASVTWVMSDNTTKELTKAELQTVVQQYTLRKAQVFEEYNLTLSQLYGLDTLGEVEQTTWVGSNA